MSIFFKKKRPLRVEMLGFENGKKASLDSNPCDAPIHSTEYYRAIQKEIRPLEDVMVSFACALKEQKRVDDKIEILRSLISSYYDLKSKCVSLGPDFKTYFSEMWEHTRNSKSEDVSYIARFESELDYLEMHKDEIKAEEELRLASCENLQEKILSLLQSKEKVLQTEIYKMFDPTAKDEISTILYYLAKEGIVKREKSGRTYLIELIP